MKTEDKKALLAAIFQGANVNIKNFVGVNDGTLIFNDSGKGNNAPLADAEVVVCEEVREEVREEVCEEGPAAGAECTEASKEQATIDKLAPIFWNDRKEAELFLKRIKGLKPKHVIQAVNELLRERKISSASVHRDLHKILNEDGYYSPSESNWNKMLVVPRW